jgi:flavin-dependent dehydrogenase
MKTDVVIVGAGPAGIFTALEMIRKGSKKKIVMVEKGQSGGGAPLPQGQDRPVHELQALLPYHHGLFRRRRLLRRQALPEP